MNARAVPHAVSPTARSVGGNQSSIATATSSPATAIIALTAREARIPSPSEKNLVTMSVGRAEERDEGVAAPAGGRLPVSRKVVGSKPGPNVAYAPGAVTPSNPMSPRGSRSTASATRAATPNRTPDVRTITRPRPSARPAKPNHTTTAETTARGTRCVPAATPNNAPATTVRRRRPVPSRRAESASARPANAIIRPNASALYVSMSRVISGFRTTRFATSTTGRSGARTRRPSSRPTAHRATTRPTEPIHNKGARACSGSRPRTKLEAPLNAFRITLLEAGGKRLPHWKER